MKKKQFRKLLDRYRVTDGSKFRLKDYDSDDNGGGLVDHGDAKALLAHGVGRLTELQERLYAQGEWSLLCVFQAMDAAGKDGTIKHVMTGVNPQGVQVSSFKAPGPQQLAHDFLWRIHMATPERGRIGIFNRSHYEDVLVARVHPELLTHAGVPEALRGKHFWRNRLESIAGFERLLTHEGTVVRKFFLNVSREEQRRRFLERLDTPDKHWKFSENDIKERGFWDDYMAAYEAAIAATATEESPWFVVPADNKWFTHLVVVAAMVEALDDLDLRLPPVTPEREQAIAAARQALDSEGA